MRFNTNNTKTPRGEFRRMTLVHMSTTNIPMLNEQGYNCEIPINAGPAVLDYSPLWVMAGVDAVGEADPTYLYEHTLFANSREFTWVLCDGRLMGPNKADNFPIESDSVVQNMEWEDCEYVVLKDIQWEIVVARPDPRMVPIYQLAQYDADQIGGTLYGADNEAWSADLDDTVLSDWLDAKVTGAIEVEGGDVWSGYTDNFEAPYIVTLMRVPFTASGGENEETTADIIQGETGDPRMPLGLAPIGMLYNDEITDINEFVTSGPDVGGFPSKDTNPWSHLEGTTEWNDNVALSLTREWHDRAYRAWEPYDDATGVFLDRKTHCMPMQLPTQHNANDIWTFDDEIVEGFEPLGTPAYPTMTGGRKLYRIRGTFAGEVVVSARDPRPLILHIAGAPVRVTTSLQIGGVIRGIYYRPPVIPVRWHLTAMVKAR